jgi:hypothetical protein
MKSLIIPVTLNVLLYFSVPVQSIEDEATVTSEQVATACKNTFPQEIEGCIKMITILLFDVPLQSFEDKEVKLTLEQVTTACKNTFPQEIELCQRLLANLLVVSEITNSSEIENSVLNAIEWKTYSNEIVGISFNYPSNWDVVEKENRFDTGPDVTVSEGLTKFFVMKLDEDGNDAMKLFGLADATKFMEGGETEDDIDSTVIEKTSLTKHEIGGEKTGSFLIKTEKGLLERAQQFLLLNMMNSFIQ